MHKNLRSFIDTLRGENDLIEIEAEVDPYLELAEIHRFRILRRRAGEHGQGHLGNIESARQPGGNSRHPSNRTFVERWSAGKICSGVARASR